MPYSAWVIAAKTNDELSSRAALGCAVALWCAGRNEAQGRDDADVLV